MILVSSCLLGLKAKYDGGFNPIEQLIKMCPGGSIIPACPEQLGGLPVPRQAAEIRGGTGADVLAGRAGVYGREGLDLTEAFVAGARETLKMCRLFGIKAAILKERSPSCGSRLIYDGTFSGVRLQGQGVTAALLISEGIAVYPEEELNEELMHALFRAGAL